MGALTAKANATSNKMTSSVPRESLCDPQHSIVRNNWDGLAFIMVQPAFRHDCGDS